MTHRLFMSTEEADQFNEMRQQINDIWQALNGESGRLGLSQKVSIMWHGHVVVACAFCTCFGTVGGIFLEAWIKGQFHQ